MLGRTKMLGGVLVLRTVAAAHVPAGPAHSQVNPPVPRCETLLAAGRVGLLVVTALR